MSTLEIENISKIFTEGENDIVAVDDLSISVDSGEFLVMVGPSGCGKSTTLRSVAGLESPTEGEIRINGKVVTDQKPADRDIAMVFQSYALYPHMTARQNMSFGLKMSTDMTEEEIEERVAEIAELMDINDLLEKRPGDLSGGQQQRVALGRAIVRDPAVFLLDEPLSNLDAKLRTQMRTELQNLQQELEVTTIYVTHDQTEAMTMGDRIAILFDGKLQQIGTPLECYYYPSNKFVAGFIGSPSMNFFDIELQNGSTETSLKNSSFNYTISDSFAKQLAGVPEDLILGIRPEHIEIARTDDHNSISTTVDVVEPLGDITYVYAPIGDQTITATAYGDIEFQSGDSVNILFPQDKIHIFDRETGETIKNSDVTTSEAKEQFPGPSK